MRRSWPTTFQNLPEGTLDSWSELCHQFKANFESGYARLGNETDVHTIQQRPGGIPTILHLVVLPSSQYHSSYL
jgi:hypothetical protein